ncbi:MAG TPA: FGGY-family carbohydrate kinase, partial [Methylomirabilota bacterium]|nr:FGGY-family carbohydrate kinase [Methylomirabilota bacterium]
DDIVQAVMEGFAFTLMDADAALAKAGVRPVSLAAVGGGARSRLWIEMLASALDRPITLYAGAALGPANGATRLARIARTGASVSDICTKPPVADVIAPSPRRRDALNARYPEFRGLYRALKASFAARR